jgi:hypothetical protein
MILIFRKLLLLLVLVLTTTGSAQGIDTLSPRMTIYVTWPPSTYGIPPCHYHCDSLLITEERPNDVGLREIKIINATNMDITTIDVSLGAHFFYTKVCVIDSLKDGQIRLRIIDTAGNYIDAGFCFDVPEGDVRPMSIESCKLVYGPTPTLQVTLAQPQMIDMSILSVLGTIVASQQVMSNSENSNIPIDVSKLATGIYFIVVKSGNSIYTLKLHVS